MCNWLLFIDIYTCNFIIHFIHTSNLHKLCISINFILHIQLSWYQWSSL